MNFAYRLALGSQKLLSWLLIPFFWFRTRKRPQQIPKITNDILKCSATTLAEKIRKKEITCTEITNAYIDRIKLVNPIINAVVEDRFSAALEEAKQVDKIMANNEYTQDYISTKYPLFGVPLTVKESCSLKDLSYSVGSKMRIGFKATEDGDAVRRLREAGAIPLLVSNTPELCLAWETVNLVTGRTLNPYNTNCTSAGSSGGEGALLGCGASVIGVGSDVAGSIRIPAMFNGIFGHKPTPRIISITGHHPMCSDKNFANFLVVGPMTRYAEDLKLMTKIMCQDVDRLNLNAHVNLDKLNVFFTYNPETSFIYTKLDKDIKSAMDKGLEHLKKNCRSTINNYKFNLKNSCEMSSTLLYKIENIPNVLKDTVTDQVKGNLYFELLKALLGLSEYSLHGLFFHFLEKTNIFVPRSKFAHYQKKAECLKNDFIEKLGNNGVFLYPTFPNPAVPHDKILLDTNGIMYTMIFNVLGMPCTHVTLGMSKTELPIGFQVVAAPFQDRLCFAIAEELEKCFGGWTEPKFF